MSRPCCSVSDVANEICAMIRQEKEKFPNDDAEFYFRGEACNFLNKSNAEIGSRFDPSIDREDKKFWLYERELYQEALRLNIVSFKEDSTMTDRLARMQHYQMPTRFMDLSENALQALFFGCGGLDPRHGDTDKFDGFIRVIKVSKKKMKSFTSDIIVAISHLPLVDRERINPEKNDGLDTLRYEIMKERPAFGLARDMPDQAIKLLKEIQQVWAFKPILNNRRIQAQKGLFLAFGCRKGKKPLHPIFSVENYDNENEPSYGIKQIGAVRILSRFKHDMLNELRWFGVQAEAVYPDLSNVSNVLRERYSK